MPSLPKVVSQEVYEFLNLEEIPNFGDTTIIREVAALPIDVILEGDPRLTDSRTPNAHAASHAPAGSDPITIVDSQLPDTAVAPGVYTNATVTVDQKGRLTFAASGGGGGTGDLLAANNLSDLADLATGFDNIKQSATDSYEGVVELATSGETLAGKVVQGNDARLNDARSPNGAAGGVLSGSYPNPGFAADMATQAELDAHTSNTSNPHSVTKAQVGLSALTNDAQAIASIYPNTVPVFGGAIPVSDGGSYIAQVIWQDFTISSLGEGTISANAVTASKLADMAQATIKGRASAAGTGDPQDLSPDQVSTILDSATDPFARTSAVPSGGGDVTGPATHADFFVPLWNGVNTKALQAGKQLNSLSSGIAATDDGKIPLLDASHGLSAVKHTAVSSTATSALNPLSISFTQTSGSHTGALGRPTLTGNRVWVLQDADGTLAHLTDIPARVWVTWDGTTATTTANVSGTWTRSGTTATITVTGHGHMVGHKVYASFTTGGATSGLYDVVTVADANTLTITVPAAGTSGNVTLLRKPIKASSGVQSVTYSNTAGIFYVNFSTVFANADYATPTGSCNSGAGTAGVVYPGYGVGGKTTKYCVVLTALITGFTTAVSVANADQTFVGTQ